MGVCTKSTPFLVEGFALYQFLPDLEARLAGRETREPTLHAILLSDKVDQLQYDSEILSLLELRRRGSLPARVISTYFGYIQVFSTLKSERSNR